jgi:hypothetical protein
MVAVEIRLQPCGWAAQSVKGGLAFPSIFSSPKITFLARNLLRNFASKISGRKKRVRRKSLSVCSNLCRGQMSIMTVSTYFESGYFRSVGVFLEQYVCTFKIIWRWCKTKSRATRWVLKKYLPKCNPTHFLSKLVHTVCPRKKFPKKLCHLCN